MDKRRMHGILDPITLGFVLSILGGVSVLTLEKQGSDAQTAQQAQSGSVEMSQQVEDRKESLQQPDS